MKAVTTLFIGALIVALAGYLYYQRTQNDMTIRLPKISSIVSVGALVQAA